MRRLYIGLTLLVVTAAAVVGAAGTVAQIPVWTGMSYTWPTLGQGLAIKNGVLDVVPAPQIRLVTDVELKPNEQSAYALPTGTQSVVVFLNGLRQHSGGDYTIIGNAIVPLVAWPSDSLVTVDYVTSQ